jgi:hypothetical protein
LNNLKSCFWRQRDEKQSNEFSFSRFLVPYLSDYNGYAVFMDCDMLMRVDVAELMQEIAEDSSKAAYVVKHTYQPRDGIKYLNTIQYSYPRKNWSSFVVWNCGHEKNKKLTPGYVNVATGLELHRFTWLDDEDLGELDVKWNWLVGEYESPNSDVKNVHWTIGGPYFNEFRNVDFSDEWFEQRDRMLFCKQRNNL